MPLKDKIFSRTAFVVLLTFASLAIYLVLLLGCTMQGGSIEKLYWVSVSLNANGQHDGHLNQNNITTVQIGYFGLCTNTLHDTQYTCFPRDSPPPTSSILISSSLFTASIALQKNSLYPIPAGAGVLFFLGMILFAVMRNSVGRKKSFAKGFLGLSAALGLAGALVGMASGKALEGANELFGGGTEIRVGKLLGVMLWVATGIHVFVVGYVTSGFHSSV